MNKLSLKKKPAALVANQGKITGFFNKPKVSTVVCEETRTALENVTNKVEKVSEKDADAALVSSPIIVRKEREVFDKTPEMNNKRKFKLKSRRLGSGQVDGKSKTKLEEKEGFKRKLEEEDQVLLTSPVFPHIRRSPGKGISPFYS